MSAVLLIAMSTTLMTTAVATSPPATPHIQRQDRADGITVMVAENHSLPRVSFRVALRSGSAEDELATLGLTRLHSELILRGTQRLARRAFAEEIEGYGSSLNADASADSEIWSGEALSRYFEPTFALLAEALTTPAFADSELKKLVRELEADRLMRRDDDGLLARFVFRRLLFRNHLYGRDALGSPETLASITSTQLKKEHARRFVRGNIIVAAAGDISLAQLSALVDKYFAPVAAGPSLTRDVPPPPEPAGVSVYLIDKPERTQTQIVIGRPGVKAANPDYLPMQVATTAFGGTFTAPLMHEVREVRGWSYGAYASLTEMRGRGSFALSAATAQGDAKGCLELMVELYRKFVGGEYDLDLFQFGRQFLINQYPFNVATPDSRLGEYLHAELVGLAPEAVTDYPQRLAKLGAAEIRGMPARYLSADDFIVVMVGTASVLKPELEKLGFEVANLKVLPYDRELSPVLDNDGMQ